jgi:hypothetical protein
LQAVNASAVGPLGGEAMHRSVVLCPKAKLPASVELGDSVSIETCSRSTGLDCSGDCLPQLSYSAGEVKEFLAPQMQEWCSICGSMLTSEDWYASRLAAVGGYRTAANHLDDSRTVDGNRQRMCWNCSQTAIAIGGAE